MLPKIAFNTAQYSWVLALSALLVGTGLGRRRRWIWLWACVLALVPWASALLYLREIAVTEPTTYGALWWHMTQGAEQEGQDSLWILFWLNYAFCSLVSIYAAAKWMRGMRRA